MAIYGTGLLAGCLLVGLLLGRLVGWLVGVEANVGGVGIAMVLLILVTEQLRRRGHWQAPSEQGVLFWSSIYIPIVVAMAASQNVVAAVQGGVVAILDGVLSVLACFALVPLITKLGARSEPEKDEEASA